MPHRLLIALAIVSSALAIAPDAWAKGPVTSLRVCGADGCASVPVPARLRDPLGLEQLMMTARAAKRMPSPGPFYRLRVGVRGNSVLTFYYLPSGKLLRDQDWLALGPGLSRAIDAAVAGQPPILPAVTGVRIGAHRVADPQAYAPLLRPLPISSGTLDASVTRSIGIYLTTATPSPWGLGSVVFALYEPQTGLVDVAGAVRVPPASVRRAIERDARLVAPAAATSSGGGSGVMWAGGATALAASAGVLIVRRRRRRGGGG